MKQKHKKNKIDDKAALTIDKHGTATFTTGTVSSINNTSKSKISLKDIRVGRDEAGSSAAKRPAVVIRAMDIHLNFDGSANVGVNYLFADSSSARAFMTKLQDSIHYNP